MARDQRASCTSTLTVDLKSSGSTTVFFRTRETIDIEDAMTTRIAASQGSSQRCVHIFSTKAPRTVRAMIETRAKMFKTIAATAIDFQKDNLTSEVAASTMRRIVDVDSRVNVRKLAPQMMGREEEVRRRIGAIETTEDQRVDDEFQKVVLGDKEVAGVAR